jgi:transcriptional regulator with XRE-family HTH domain
VVQHLLPNRKGDAELQRMKMGLARSLRRRRQAHHLSQVALAKILGTSQSRLARMETADETVTLDLLARSLLATGASRKEIAKALGQGGGSPES